MRKILLFAVLLLIFAAVSFVIFHCRYGTDPTSRDALGFVSTLAGDGSPEVN
jgi:hypothetical protein